MDKAAAYVRMSTDRQDTSPEQQREEISALAERHNLKIVRWYADEGISGDKTKKRLDFQRMLVDGQTGEFDTILCWDQDRFGRFDSIEAGHWIHPLREKDVVLITVTDGVIDWSEMSGRIVYQVKQEGKHQYLRDLSNNVTRGMEKLARNGLWVSGKPPLGYVVGPDRHLKLDSPKHVATVRRIFEEYLSGKSTRSIAADLSIDGILSPKGKQWTATGISGVLKNTKYLGHLTYNERCNSKYKREKKSVRTNRTEKWIVVEDTHPAIVTRDEFDRVAELLKSRKVTHSTPHRDRGQFAFGNLLRCGHCGAKMIGSGENGKQKYVCYSYRQKAASCHPNRIDQPQLLTDVVRILKERLTKQNLSTMIEDRLKRADVGVKVSKQQIADMHGKIEQAERRLLEVDSDMVPIVTKRIRMLRDELEEMEVSVAAQKAMKKQRQSTKQKVDRVLAWLDRMTDAQQTANIPVLRSLMMESIDRIVVTMDRIPQGKRRHTYEFERGELYLKADKVAGTVQRSWPYIVRSVESCSGNSAACHFGNHTGKD